jgi:hypothetical protein
VIVALATATLYAALYHETHDLTWVCAAVFFVGIALVKA